MNRKHMINIGLAALLLVSSSAIAGNRKKQAQSGLQFLSVVSDARGAAMGGAVHTLTGMKSSALFFNPACMANMEEFIDISVSQNQWIADIAHNAVSMAIKPGKGQYGVIGFSLLAVDYGDLQGTMVDMTVSDGFVKTGVFSPTAMALGVGYAKKLTDRFSVGGQVKWVRQTLGENTYPVDDSTNAKVTNEVTPLVYDFGTLFHTGFHSLVFGMSIRNFAPEVKFESEAFQPPLVFTMGLSMDLVDVLPLDRNTHSLLTTVNASHYRSHPEQVCIGFDYTLMQFISVRGGYILGNDEDNVSFGMGITRFGFALDYAYTPFGVFDNVQRITARFNL